VPNPGDAKGHILLISIWLLETTLLNPSPPPFSKGGEFFPLFDRWGSTGIRANQTQGADNPWLLGLFFLVNNTQSALFPKLDHTLGKGVIVDAASKLPVENIDCNLTQRTIVDILDSTVKFWCIEECPFDLFSVSHKKLIGSEAGS
jgi:hypothetical protein